MRNIAIALVAAMLGHAAVASAAETGHQTTASEWKALADRIPIGTEVRIRVGGEHLFVAVLMVVDDEGVVVQPATRIPEPPRRVLFDQLNQLELAPQKRTSLHHAAGTGAGIGAATFLF